ncbi:hypothetical protein ACIQXF_11990 [Lysinibacillus sp. NPDC097231]|uniref:hypothetical protein n=1 Tax=Lysinibacillus sp. NPDC097231 TaxID=3364142 RepID=UPI0038048CE1
MNKWQIELVKVAGDMVASKERVKKRILQQQKVKPKKPIRFALLTAIVTLCLAGFVLVQLLNKETQQSAQMFNETQLEHFENVTHFMWGEQDDEFNKSEAFNRYEQLVAYYYYAKSLGMTTSKAELEAEKKERYDELVLLQQSTPYAELFQEQGLDQYFKMYIEPMLPMYAARKKLNTLYDEKYPTFSMSAHQIAANDALRYFQAHFAEQATAFQKEMGIRNYSNSRGLIYVGTAIKIESNAFLFVEGAIPEDLEKLSEAQIVKQYDNATWYPILDDFPVKRGDYISLESSGSETHEENGVATTYGLLNNIEVIEYTEPPVTTKLDIQNEQEVIQFFQLTDWQTPDNHDKMKEPPKYSFMLEGVRVDVWISYGHSLYLHKVDAGTIHLDQERSEKLKEILGIKES